MKNKSAVILLSGGIDSATAAAVALKDGYGLRAMTFRYGQRHDVEIEFACRISDAFRIADHVIVDIPSSLFTSALMKNSPVAVPRDQDPLEGSRIPDTYVPARNILFLAYALAYAESNGSGAVFIGANAVDFSGYPDCRPEFFSAFQAVADRGTRSGVTGAGIRIMTPVIDLTKAQIISLGVSLGVDYSLTHSCYDPSPDGASCGRCDSCILRKKGFADAGISDPTRYGG